MSDENGPGTDDRGGSVEGDETSRGDAEDGDAGGGAEPEGGTEPEPEDEVARERAGRLDEKEQRLDGRERELDGRERELDERERELDEREQELLDRREELVETRERLEGKEARLEERENALDDRETALNERERELAERAEELDRREETLERYVGDQLSGIESTIADTVRTGVTEALDGYDLSGADDRFGVIGNLLLALVGIVLVVAGVANLFATETGVLPPLFASSAANFGASAVLTFGGLAANLAAAAGRL